MSTIGVSLIGNIALSGDCRWSDPQPRSRTRNLEGKRLAVGIMSPKKLGGVFSRREKDQHTLNSVGGKQDKEAWEEGVAWWLHKCLTTCPIYNTPEIALPPYPVYLDSTDVASYALGEGLFPKSPLRVLF